MDNQPKTEPGSPPRFGSSNHRNLINMNIRELVLVLRAAFKMEDFDKVEEVLVSRYERLNTEIGQLREKVEMERLTRFHVEDEFRKREELCEKGKRAQESYERLLKEVKISGFADRNFITELRKKNHELECEVCELKKLKEKWKDNSNAIAELRKNNGELVCEVCELKKLKQKWIDDKNVLAAIGVKNSELEEAVKKNLATINELRNENSKLLEEKRGFEMLVESLNRKCEELHGHVRRLKDDAKLLVSEPPAEAGHGVTIFEDKGEEDVEFGNDTMEAAPLQRNERILHSLGVDGTAQLPNKGSKDAQGAPLVMGRLELEKDIGIVDQDEDDDDGGGGGCTSQSLDGKKAISRIIVKNEHPSSSMAGQQKSIFTNAQMIEMIKRKIPFSDSDTSTSTSDDDSVNVDNLPLSSVLFDGTRKTNNPPIMKVYSKRGRRM